MEEEDFLIKLTGKRVSATGFRIKMERKWKKYLLLYFIPTGSIPLDLETTETKILLRVLCCGLLVEFPPAK